MLFQTLTIEITNSQPTWLENRPVVTEMHPDISFAALQGWLNKKLRVEKPRIKCEWRDRVIVIRSLPE